ncbi:ROK family transcriptional regulator [Halostreptopolyspora alba]|uniref:ROK family protein n=1 Tax=Halostreptopolyspora alba TaxID=2487137 RepID=A0A3N0EE81_9ACTN|nr:ROK family protein [Nocardiopsaceae bacterium YIM 96095]
MSRPPGTPRLLRQLNDRAALELLLSSGPLTRSQLGDATGLSKVTASQMLSRLEERQLVQVVGSWSRGRGPNAALYAVVPSSAYVAALDVSSRRVAAAVADITGHVVGEVTVSLDEASDPVEAVRSTVLRLVRDAEAPIERIRACVLGTPGVVNPETGDIRFSFDLPPWYEGVLRALRDELRSPITIENDVNLAAHAEQVEGVATDVVDFALVWLGSGVGMAIMLDGRIRRGRFGGAGEIGYLPVPGVPAPGEAGNPAGNGDPTGEARLSLPHGFQALVGARAVERLAAEHGLPDDAATAVTTARRAGTDGEAFLDELAERVARGVTSVCVVLDPGLVVLGGPVARVGGADLAERVARSVERNVPNVPQVHVGTVGSPVLRGASLWALRQAREEVLASTE